MNLHPHDKSVTYMVCDGAAKLIHPGSCLSNFLRSTDYIWCIFEWSFASEKREQGSLQMKPLVIGGGWKREGGYRAAQLCLSEVTCREEDWEDCPRGGWALLTEWSQSSPSWSCTSAWPARWCRYHCHPIWTLQHLACSFLPGSWPPVLQSLLFALGEAEPWSPKIRSTESSYI